MKDFKMIISGGGTGGHIFPALAIAGEVKGRFPGCDILFVGASGRMEMEKIPAAGYSVIGLPVMGFPRKPGLDTLRFFVRLAKSMVKARKIISEFQPQIVVGVGGYASGPILLAAISRNIPTLIQEQNSFAGITNRLLGKKVNRICVAYEGMERFFPADKIILTGNPVRQNLIPGNMNRDEALSCFNIPENRKVLMVIGGSLGARSLNDTVLANLEMIRNSEIQIIWQTGTYYYEEMVARTRGNLPANVHLHQFITRMESAYLAADLVISRAGAGTISELCLVGKPSVLVPSPNVAEDHQTKNALVLVRKEAASMVRDHEMREKLFPEAFQLINDSGRLKAMSENIRKLAHPDAASEIVDEILKLTGLCKDTAI